MKHIIDGFNRQNSSSPALGVQSILNLCELFTIPRLHLEENPLSSSQSPSPSPDPFCRSPSTVNRGCRAEPQGAGRGRRVWMRRQKAPCSGGLCRDCAKPTASAATREDSVPPGRGCRESLGRLRGPYPHTSRRFKPSSQVASRFSPPSEGRWYIPADSESFKRALGG